MGFSDFFSSGGTTQQSNSGFVGWDKPTVSKISANQLFDTLYKAQADLNSPVPRFDLQSNGLFGQQQAAANNFANNMFAKASAGGAMRGQFSPNNTPGIVGSAITNMGSQLFPLISNNMQMSAMLPEQIKAQRFQNVMSPLQALVGGLGGSSSGQSSGPGLGYVGGSAFMNSFGSGLGKQFTGTTEQKPSPSMLFGMG